LLPGTDIAYCNVGFVALKFPKFSVRDNQHYAPIGTIALIYILAATCFGSSLPSSGSFLDPSELLEIQIELAVYLKCVTDKRFCV
jgi:hypothetical protein